MTIYKPYTYLIGWSKFNKYYYGVRYAKDCHPDDFWVSYFTSSKYVGELREKVGEPDIIQIRKTFICPDKAIEWEYKVIQKMKLHRDERFLNQCSFPAMSLTLITESNKKRVYSKETLEKMSNSQKGKKMSNETKRKISKANKGKPRPWLSKANKGVPKTEDHRKKISKANTGKKFTEDRKRKISEKAKGRKLPKMCCIICKDGHEFDGGNLAKHYKKNHFTIH